MVKNQYVGDLNDFAKYQLLRLCATVFEQIIVAWMLTADDDLGDGAKIGYLREAAWRIADPKLFDGLGALVDEKQRSVAAIETAGLLPRCSFASEPVPLEVEKRQAYFEAIAADTTENTLVFFDPDNGLEVATTPKHRRGAEKYLYLDELAPFRATGSSLLIYQHFPRVQRAPYVEAARARLEDELKAGYVTFAVHTSHVAFLFAVCGPHMMPLREALASRCADSPLLSFIG
jgi:hypothetical protein